MIRRNHFMTSLVALFLTAGVIYWFAAKTSHESGFTLIPLATAQTASNGALSSMSNLLEIVRQRDEERRKLDPNLWWKTPVSFYGRAVDQNGDPVPQADVKLEVNDTSARGTTEYHVKSDANGFFSLTGVKGANLDVIFAKDGYYQSRAENHFFSYAGAEQIHKPDPKNPALFHLHKGGEKVALIRNDLVVRARVGEPIDLDLLNRMTNSTGAQLRVELLESDRGGRNGFGAKCRIRLSVPDGGIQTNVEEFPFVAPEAGYQSSLEIGTDAGKPPAGWGDHMTRAVFLRMSGRYARANFHFNPSGSYIRCEYYVNPTGSRDLELEPLLQFDRLEYYNAYLASHPLSAK